MIECLQHQRGGGLWEMNVLQEQTLDPPKCILNHSPSSQLIQSVRCTLKCSLNIWRAPTRSPSPVFAAAVRRTMVASWGFLSSCALYVAFAPSRSPEASKYMAYSLVARMEDENCLWIDWTRFRAKFSRPVCKAAMATSSRSDHSAIRSSQAPPPKKTFQNISSYTSEQAKMKMVRARQGKGLSELAGAQT